MSGQMDRIRERLAGMREQQDEGEASAREPWAPQRDSDGTPLTVREIVGQAIGTGSVCWDPRPSGVFDSETASRVVDGAVAALADLARRQYSEPGMAQAMATPDQLPDAGPYVEPGLAEAAAAVRAPHAADARLWHRQDAAGNWLPRDQQPLADLDRAADSDEVAPAARAPRPWQMDRIRKYLADHRTDVAATVCESCEMVGGHAPSCTLHPPRGFWANPVQGADYLRDLIEESSSAALAEPLENVPSTFLLRGVNGEPLLMVHVMAVGS